MIPPSTYLSAFRHFGPRPYSWHWHF